MPTSKQLGWAAAVLTVAASLWAWGQGLSGPFHYDDFVTPLNDPASQSLGDWRQNLAVTLRPATKLTYAAEASAGAGADPATRRTVSIALHLATAALLLLLITRLAPGAAPLSAAVLAALWFIHPVHADNVLLISGRSALLAGLFLLAALLAMERSRPWLAGILFLLACFSRETALAGLLPLAVLAASRPQVSARETLRELGPVLLAGGLIVLWIVSTPRYFDLGEYSFLGRPFWGSLASQVGAVPVGLGLLFNPVALSIDYGIPLPRSPFDPVFLLGCVLYLAAAVGILLSFRRSRAAAVGLALWLAALLPTQSVVPKLDALTNRPLALALAGLLLAAAPLLRAGAWQIRRSRVSGSQQRNGTAWSPRARVAGSLGALALFALLGTATANRAALFQSELSLWQDAAAKSRANARPHLQHAVLLERAGRGREAHQAAVAAQAIDPFSSQVALFVRSFRPEGEFR